jgi:hypothetical protein
MDPRLRTIIVVASIILAILPARAQNAHRASTGTEPVYALVTTSAKHVRDDLTFEFVAPKVEAKEWVVYSARLPELTTQTEVHSARSPAGRPAREREAARYLQAPDPAARPLPAIPETDRRPARAHRIVPGKHHKPVRSRHQSNFDRHEMNGFCHVRFAGLIAPACVSHRRGKDPIATAGKASVPLRSDQFWSIQLMPLVHSGGVRLTLGA